jgi:GntP family permease
VCACRSTAPPPRSGGAHSRRSASATSPLSTKEIRHDTTLLPLADPLTSAGNTRLIVAALLGIATVVVLITVAKFHPFLGLLIGTAVMGAAAGVAPLDILTSFKTGFGTTMGTVGILIALGAMVGKILADTGGSDAIVETIVGRAGALMLPWAMALIAAILGLPLFFEIGVVLLVPVVLLVARRTDVPVMRVGIPALAGLSVLHGLVPPHPGPLVAIANLNADLGQTLILGLVVAVPTLVICGPLLARLIETWVPVHVTVIPGLDDSVSVPVGAGAEGRAEGRGEARSAGPGAPLDRHDVPVGRRTRERRAPERRRIREQRRAPERRSPAGRGGDPAPELRRRGRVHPAPGGADAGPGRRGHRDRQP